MAGLTWIFASAGWVLIGAIGVVSVTVLFTFILWLALLLGSALGLGDEEPRR